MAKNKEYVFNYAILALFQVQIHKKDRGLLELIQAYFKGVGKIYEEGNAVKYVVSSVEEVKIIINHFDKYPLITQKQADLELFKMAFKLILNKEHLTREGIKKIISIRASMNLGLTDSLKIAFPNIIPVLRPTIKSKIPNPYWVTGFTSFFFNDKKVREVGLELSIPIHTSSGIAICALNPGFLKANLFSDPFIKKAIKQFSTMVKASTNNPLSLVVGGKNLTSTVGMGRFTKQVRNMIELPPYQKSVILGLILSDGWLRFPSKTSKNVNLGLKQSLAHSDYIWFVFSILSHYCDNLPLYRLGKRGEKSHWGIEIVTRALPCFTELHSIFYVDGVKIIPYNIYDILTPVALAQLIMGDGSVQRHGLIICTDYYKLIDVIRLMNVLIIRYRFECTLRFHTPTQPRIYIKEGSMPLLRQIVKPHMCPSMLYKIKL